MNPIVKVELNCRCRGPDFFAAWGFSRLYVGALYHEGLAAEALLADTAKRLEVSFFYAFKAEDFGTVTNKIIAWNSDPTLQKIGPQVVYHNSLYRDVKPGRPLRVDLHSGKRNGAVIER